MSVAKKFKDVKIGEKFHTGLDVVEGDVRMVILEKNSGSSGKCIEQINFGNNRLVGGIFKFGCNKTVFVMDNK